MKNKFVGLIILDGYGIREELHGNAIKLSGAKKLEGYFNNYPYTKLNASGVSVGLPHGQMGNSEVGHLNIGAGRVVMQSLQKINHSIDNGGFFSNKALLSVINHTNNNNSTLHLIGLASSGGVHSHINHLYNLIKLARDNNVKSVAIHIITDGRDTYTDQSIKEITELENFLKDYKNYKIATVSGRFYAMDREKNFARTENAYNAIVKGVADRKFKTALEGLRHYHSNNITDEFVVPFVVAEENESNLIINENDAVIFYNFREDRMRQLSAAFLQNDFNNFNTVNFKNLKFTVFTKYDEFVSNEIVAFEKDRVKINLSSVVSDNELLQFKITETTKYAHLTYFLNGGREEPYLNEDRFLIETIKTDYFDNFPQMRAKEITDKAIELINQNIYSLMVLNYSNCDMIGHTGNLEAGISAVKVVDEQADRLINAILQAGGVAVVCADHGNVEHMIDDEGRVLTDHTTNKVPLCIIGNNLPNISLRENGDLSNIAPTVLQLLGVNVPIKWDNSLIL